MVSELPEEGLISCMHEPVGLLSPKRNGDNEAEFTKEEMGGMLRFPKRKWENKSSSLPGSVLWDQLSLFPFLAHC